MKIFEERPRLTELIGIALPILLGIVSLVRISFNSAGWGDEIFFVEGALNYANFGEFSHCTFSGVYNPLSMIAMIPWACLFGVSRVGICSFNVFWAVLSCIAIVKCLVNRGVFKSISAVVIFNAAFWSGANLSWTILCGRIDMMVMFFTVLSLIFLTDGCEKESSTLVKLFTSLLLLTTTAIGSLPIVACVGLVLFVFPELGMSRRRIFVRGVVCVLAIVIGIMLASLYFLRQHLMIFYLYNLFIAHSSHISGNLEGSAVGLAGCYLSEVPALVMYFLSVVVLAFVFRRRLNVRYVTIIGLIPAIMVGAGHYAYYYHWMFYVPVCVMFACAISSVSKTLIRNIIATFALFYLVYFQVDWFVQHSNPAFKQDQKQFLSFMDHYGKDVKPGDHIVVSSEKFFYPSVKLGLRTWVRSADHVQLCFNTMPGKVDKALNKFFKDAKRRQRAKDLIDRIENLNTPKMPTNGYLFTHDEKAKRVFPKIMCQLGCSTHIVAEEGEYGLFKIVKK